MDQGNKSRMDILAAVKENDTHMPSSEGRKYLLFITVSISVVLVFAMFQFLVVLDMELRELRPGQLLIPATVGGLFGYLLAKNRVLRERSAKQLMTIMQRDRLLEQEIGIRKQAELKLIEQKTHLEATNEELKYGENKNNGYRDRDEQQVLSAFGGRHLCIVLRDVSRNIHSAIVSLLHGSHSTFPRR